MSATGRVWKPPRDASIQGQRVKGRQTQSLRMALVAPEERPTSVRTKGSRQSGKRKTIKRKESDTISWPKPPRALDDQHANTGVEVCGGAFPVLAAPWPFCLYGLSGLPLAAAQAEICLWPCLYFSRQVLFSRSAVRRKVSCSCEG